MHATQREQFILSLLEKQGFVSFRDLEKQLDASPATIRRDLERLFGEGRITRVRGGAQRVGDAAPADEAAAPTLSGVPFHDNVARHQREKEAIGRAAAQLCAQGEAIMIDGGSTTLQMCPHLEGLQTMVLTNSLHIVNALLPQVGTKLLVPAGQVFREQNIILAPLGEDAMPRFHAPKLFMGAASVGPAGPMQADVILVGAERRLIERAEQIILLVDSSKFGASSGNVVCALNEIDIIVTDSGLGADHRRMVEQAGIQLIIA